MKDQVYVAIDVETTGLVQGSDEIIEVAAVKFRGSEILDTFSRLVHPRQSVPLKITRLTGITNADLEDAPVFNAVGAEFARFIQSHPLVGHSVGFDIAMLRAQGMQFGQSAYDTFDLATALLPRATTYTLAALADYFAIEHPADHRALNDALVSARVFVALCDRIMQLDLEDLRAIARLVARSHWPVADLFTQALRLRSAQAFTSEGPIRAREPVAFDEVVPLRPAGERQPPEPDEIDAFFAVDGPLARTFSGYEQRMPQVEMAQSVARAFRDGEIQMVEAGTGTGKSMAYLVPAALFAARSGERVVLSTNTINLQDQLFFKDIPALQTVLAASETPLEFDAALLKGRSNYLCLKRYDERRKSENLAPEEVRTLVKVQLWLPQTSSGDRSELVLIDREQSVWSKINVSPETCIGPRCPHFRECFFFKARRQAEAAHIVVVNHALLCADLTAPANVLPPYEHLIIDEAHNLEDVATDQLGFSIDQSALLAFLDDLYQSGAAQVVAGLLSELPTYLRESIAEEADRQRAEQISTQLRPTLDRARALVYECFNLLNGFVSQSLESGQYDTRLRLTPAVRGSPEWVAVQQSWQNLSDTLMVIGDGLGRLETLLHQLEHAEILEYDSLLLRVEYLRRFASEVRVNTGHIIFGDEASICWLTQDRLRDVLTLTAVPLSVSEILQAQLFAQKETAILSSATLTIAGSFDYVRSRLGLEEAVDLALESPFDYERQALVFIPNDMPEPNQRGYQQTLEQALVDLCRATGGRTLALFTANSSLRQTYAAIQEQLEEDSIAVLAQGVDGSRRALLDRFKQFPRTVLLGTSSFWEGVDVVGDALSVLAIAKLPFNVPTDPVFAARSECFSEPFVEYAVPQSILRFKQGFGRLIRSREDRGIVVVLDRRLLSKRYGRQFLESLPTTRVRTGPLAQLPGLAARFLA
jgi:predicted DnaQ family exonuclease/DinG family helicase